ncbi:HAD family hydrolase [Dyella halodurans]|uniref:HAD family hydrolase n=1 Tax=Dyella halodurans TaxID=1920171 RepID=A0ABV9C4D6_9GAMM|nr:HAD family hydrolase [Dyella halodurans]
MLKTGPVVFLLDVDNTLFDNDRFAADVTGTLDALFGEDERKRYWSIYEALRDRLGYADYLGALQQFRLGCEGNPALLRLSAYLLDYPFADGLYPGALETVSHLGTLGTTVILSDGDIVFQPHKIHQTGLWRAVGGRVLIYVHKEHMSESIQQSFPASHYVMVDDKPRLLTAMKRLLGDRLTTVFVRQGHYAAQAESAAADPVPDMTVTHIGELARLALPDFRADSAYASPE